MTKKSKIILSLIILICISILTLFYLKKKTFIFTHENVYILQTNYTGSINDLATINQKKKKDFGYIIASKKKILPPSTTSPDNTLIFGTLKLKYPNYFSNIITVEYQKDMLITVTKYPFSKNTEANIKLGSNILNTPKNAGYEYRVNNNYIYTITFNDLNSKYTNLNLKNNIYKNITLI